MEALLSVLLQLFQLGFLDRLESIMPTDGVGRNPDGPVGDWTSGRH